MYASLETNLGHLFSTKPPGKPRENTNTEIPYWKSTLSKIHTFTHCAKPYLPLITFIAFMECVSGYYQAQSQCDDNTIPNHFSQDFLTENEEKLLLNLLNFLKNNAAIRAFFEHVCFRDFSFTQSFVYQAVVGTSPQFFSIAGACGGGVCKLTVNYSELLSLSLSENDHIVETICQHLRALLANNNLP